jgi:hypothetical protein
MSSYELLLGPTIPEVYDIITISLEMLPTLSSVSTLLRVSMLRVAVARKYIVEQGLASQTTVAYCMAPAPLGHEHLVTLFQLPTSGSGRSRLSRQGNQPMDLQTSLTLALQ